MSQKTRSIELSQTIKATPEQIFPYLGEQDKIVQWFPTRAETDPVVGGHYMLAFEFANEAGTTKQRHGTFTNVESPHALAYNWDVSDTEVAFTLKEIDAGTELHLSHSGWGPDDDQAYQQHLEGWTFFLSNLKTVIEERKDRRMEEIWLKAEA